MQKMSWPPVRKAFTGIELIVWTAIVVPAIGVIDYYDIFVGICKHFIGGCE